MKTLLLCLLNFFIFLNMMGADFQKGFLVKQPLPHFGRPSLTRATTPPAEQKTTATSEMCPADVTIPPHINNMLLNIHSGPTFLDLTLANPSEALRLIKELYKGTAQNLAWAAILAGIPIYVTECTTTTTGKTCSLSRYQFPTYREAFERHVTQYAASLIDTSPQQQLNLISFGSGGLFGDLVIISNLCTLRPQANISLHLIDLTYSNFDKKTLTLTQETPISTLVSQTVSQPKKDFLCFLFYFFAEFAFSTFPNANLTINIHPEADKCLKLLTTSNPTHCILHAADLDNIDAIGTVYPSLWNSIKEIPSVTQAHSVYLDQPTRSLYIQHYEEDTHALRARAV